jgi:hypothetical protein
MLPYPIIEPIIKSKREYYPNIYAPISNEIYKSSSELIKSDIESFLKDYKQISDILQKNNFIEPPMIILGPKQELNSYQLKLLIQNLIDYHYLWEMVPYSQMIISNKNSKVTNPSKMCNCIPEWLSSRLSINDEQLVCCGCKKQITDKNRKDSIFRQVIVYPCSYKKTKIHIGSLIYHQNNECLSKFKKEMNEEERVPLFEILPIVELVNHEEIIKKHKITGLFCAYCKTGEQSHFKFHQCSCCKQVRYCNRICQIQDYKNHREFCKKKANAMTMANLYPSPIENSNNIDDNFLCTCFNQKEQNLFIKSKSNICCALDCNRKIGGGSRYFMTTYLTTCILKDGKGRPHMIPTMFCSDTCEKKFDNLDLQLINKG